MRNKLLLHLFSNFLNSQRDTSTYSAMLTHKTIFSIQPIFLGGQDVCLCDCHLLNWFPYQAYFVYSYHDPEVRSSFHLTIYQYQRQRLNFCHFQAKKSCGNTFHMYILSPLAFIRHRLRNGKHADQAIFLGLC